MYHPRLKGKHYDMGLHYGQIMHENGIQFEEEIALKEEEMTFGLASLEVCEKWTPQICEEIKGMADGLTLDYKAFGAWMMCMYGFGNVKGCTCFARKGKEGVFLGRDSDLYPELKDKCESILYRPEGKNIFLGHSTSFILIEDGINEYGLAAGINFLVTKDYQPGINTGMMVRYLLENFKTTKEAIEWIKKIPIASTQNIILADKSGELAVVECSPKQVCVRENQSFVVSSNHFVEEKMQDQHSNPKRNWYRSVDRYESVYQALSNTTKEDADYLKDVLSGRYGFICQYPKEMVSSISLGFFRLFYYAVAKLLLHFFRSIIVE